MEEDAKNTSSLAFLSQTGFAVAGLTLGLKLLSAKSYTRIIGPNENILMDFIGVGNRGTQVMHEFVNETDCEVFAG